MKLMIRCVIVIRDQIVFRLLLLMRDQIVIRLLIVNWNQMQFVINKLGSWKRRSYLTEKQVTLISFRSYNLKQGIGDKFMKLNKISFHIECFTADFLQFFTEKHQNLASWRTAVYSSLNPNITGTFKNFSNFIRS